MSRLNLPVKSTMLGPQACGLGIILAVADTTQRMLVIAESDDKRNETGGAGRSRTYAKGFANPSLASRVRGHCLRTEARLIEFITGTVGDWSICRRAMTHYICIDKKSEHVRLWATCAIEVLFSQVIASGFLPSRHVDTVLIQTLVR